MPTERDIVQDFHTRYHEAHREWDTYWRQAKKDLQFCVGDQWSSQERAYLKANRREVLTFNKVRRLVQVITGYQRQNRLGYKLEPLELASEKTAAQYSRLLMQIMHNSSGYHVMSDAFENGALKTGMQLVEVMVDYSDDPVNGDVKLRNVPFSRFLLDPNFSRRDLSDCHYMIRREWVTRDEAKSLLPKKANEISKLSAHQHDDKFVMARKTRDAVERLRWDEYWRMEPVKRTVLVDTQTGAWRWWPLNGDKDRMNIFLSQYPHIVSRDVHRPTVKMSIIIEDKLFYDGEDPLEIGEYPFVPVFGYFNPEHDDFSEKIMGIIRDIRDPQKEYNKRRSKILDMLDSQLSSGWMAEEDSVINKKDLYQAGQGKVIWAQSGALQQGKLQPIPKVDIPSGLFHLEESLNKDMMEIIGVNAEMMGQPNQDEQRVAGFLAKLRQGQGLTILQSLFDNYRLSKSLLGHKLLRVIQQNYTPDKVEKILHEPPSEEFYNKKFGKYNVNVSETVLTDSQRQMYYSELVTLKEMGAPIPWSEIMQAMPISYRENLQKSVEQAEAAQQEQVQRQQEMEQIWVKGEMAKADERTAGAEQRRAQADQNLAGAEFSRARALERLEKLPLERLEKLSKIMHELSEAMGETAETKQVQENINEIKRQRGMPGQGQQGQQGQGRQKAPHEGSDVLPQQGHMQQIIRNQMTRR